MCFVVLNLQLFPLLRTVPILAHTFREANSIFPNAAAALFDSKGKYFLKEGNMAQGTEKMKNRESNICFDYFVF